MSHKNFVDLMTTLELHQHCLKIEKTGEESKIYINGCYSVKNLNQREKLAEGIKTLMHTEEKRHTFMDLPNKLCSVPTVYYAVHFSREMIDFQLLVWDYGHIKLRTSEILARLFSTETQGLGE